MTRILFGILSSFQKRLHHFGGGNSGGGWRTLYFLRLWYTAPMRRGLFQRAAVAIVLMGSLLAPLGICLQPAQKAAHSCCAHASRSSQSVKTNCCTASAPLPAIVVAVNLPGPAPMTIAQEFISLDEFSMQRELPRATVTPPHSPPPGAFVLRI
jgi:hypothetical protein